MLLVVVVLGQRVFAVVRCSHAVRLEPALDSLLEPIRR